MKHKLNEGTSNFYFDNRCVVVTDEDFEVNNIPEISDSPINNSRTWPRYEVEDYGNNLEFHKIVLCPGYYEGACIDFVESDSVDEYASDFSYDVGNTVDYFYYDPSSHGWFECRSLNSNYRDKNRDKSVTKARVLNEVMKIFDLDFMEPLIKKAVYLVESGECEELTEAFDKLNAENYYDKYLEKEIEKDAKEANKEIDRLKADYGYKEVGVSGTFSNGETVYHYIGESKNKKTMKNRHMQEKINRKRTAKKIMMESKLLRNRKRILESIDDVEFEAFITNLGKYNEGHLIGEWVKFPMDEDDFEKILKKIGINEEYEEWFVTDYNDPVGGAYEELGEYPSYEDLNEYGEIMENADLVAVKNVIEAVGCTKKEAVEGLENGEYTFYEGLDSYGDLGEYIIDSMGGIEFLSDETKSYFIDLDMLGRDVRMEYYADDDEMPETAGEYWCGDEDASDAEIGQAILDEVGSEGINNIDYYFDYEEYGRELCMDDEFTITSDGAVQSN